MFNYEIVSEQENDPFRVQNKIAEGRMDGEPWEICTTINLGELAFYLSLGEGDAAVRERIDVQDMLANWVRYAKEKYDNV